MVDYYLSQGFCYFDTAYNYHKEFSEIGIRKALVERHPRDSFLLADKMPTFYVKNPEDLDRFFEEQLERCGADYFDFYLLHNLGNERYGNMSRLGDSLCSLLRWRTPGSERYVHPGTGPG